MTIGEWLKEERKKRGITQKNLAKFLNVKSVTVCRWETGATAPNYIRASAEYVFDNWSVLGRFNPDALNDNPILLDGSWLSEWLSKENVKGSELARALGVSQCTVSNWKKPETKLPIVTEYAIRQAMKALTERRKDRDEVKVGKDEVQNGEETQENEPS